MRESTRYKIAIIITLFGFSLLPVSSLAQKPAVTAPQSDLKVWQEFEEKCIFGEATPSNEDSKKAITALKEILGAKNIFCTTYPDDIITANDHWKKDYRHLRMVITPSSKAPKGSKPHPLCDLAEKVSPGSTISAEVCFLFPFATAAARESTMDGAYIGNDFSSSGFLKQIALPPDFIRRLLKSKDAKSLIQNHEGLQFALAQHKIHNQGHETGKISPFYASLMHDDQDYNTILDLELWRIPAVRSALAALGRQLKTKPSSEKEKNIRAKMNFYLKRGKKKISYAKDELSQLQKQIKADSAEVETEKEWDDLVWTTYTYPSKSESKKVAIFYSNPNAVDPDKKIPESEMRDQIVRTLNALENEKKFLNKVAGLLKADKEKLIKALILEKGPIKIDKVKRQPF